MVLRAVEMSSVTVFIFSCSEFRPFSVKKHFILGNIILCLSMELEYKREGQGSSGIQILQRWS